MSVIFSMWNLGRKKIREKRQKQSSFATCVLAPSCVKGLNFQEGLSNRKQDEGNLLLKGRYNLPKRDLSVDLFSCTFRSLCCQGKPEEDLRANVNLKCIHSCMQISRAQFCFS